MRNRTSRSRASRSTFLVAFALALAAGCNRAALRFPGASLPFPGSPAGFVSSTKAPLTVAVAMPVDARAAHYGEKIANTHWKAVSTDGLWISSTPGVVRERIQADLAASGIFSAVAGDPAARADLTLDTEVDAFCSQVRGFVIARAAGIVAIKFTVERDGLVLYEHRFEKVVTDADPAYTGLEVATVEQAMNRALSDSLRELLRDFLADLAAKAPEWKTAPAAAASR